MQEQLPGIAVALKETTSVPASPDIPFAFARRHGVVVTAIAKGGADISHKPGLKLETLTELRRHLGVPLRLVATPAEQFESVLTGHYERQTHEAHQIVQDIDETMDFSQLAKELAEPGDLLESADDAPIIRLINALLMQAVRENASDIHIEPFESRLVVRFRVDGVLREVLQPQRAVATLLVSRIKVMAHLDIAEKRLPQDGRLSLKVGGLPVDVRVSTIPSGHGERVVMRLLSKQEGRLDLEQLGLSDDLLIGVCDVIQRSHGIVLVTGPTGSGKTTTLYAVLQRLNDRSRNILTVEDPIEYYIDGVGQTQVNNRVDMSFARGLRAILRQDPDVVMVGEIRDLETAQVAVQASLTGHLVFSTLHTNTAAGALTRLRDMGVEPFLLSSSLLGVLAQRLVRRLCDHCKKPIDTNAVHNEQLLLDKDKRVVVFEPCGCEKCGYTGYKGRIGLFELVLMDDELRRRVHDGVSELEVVKYARGFFPSLRIDGSRRVLKGDTSLQELLRVTQQS